MNSSPINRISRSATNMLTPTTPQLAGETRMKHTSELARNLLTPACMVPVLNRFYPSNENTTGRTSQSYPRSGGKVERPKVPRFMQKNGHCNIRQAAQDKRE